MSRVIEFRTRVIDKIREAVPELREIDWYDGVFDEKDIEAWSLKTPCCFVSVNRAPTSPISTGELNIPLHCTAVVIADDHTVRDGDEVCWEIIEKMAIFCHHNTFGDPNAAAANEVVFERISDPAMRREGVAIGAVRFTAGLTVGPSLSARHEFIYDPATGQRVMPLPRDLFLGITSAHMPDGRTSNDRIDLTPDPEE